MPPCDPIHSAAAGTALLEPPLAFPQPIPPALPPSLAPSFPQRHVRPLFPAGDPRATIPAAEATLDQASRIERLIEAMRGGDVDTRSELIELVYGELRAIAQRNMGRQAPGHTLQPTALVNEALMRLIKQDDWVCRDRAHLMRLVSTAMRHVLVDHARSKKSRRRQPPGERQELDAALAAYESDQVDIVALDDALSDLEKDDPDLAQVIELRFFGGLTLEECAEILEVSEMTVRRRLRMAKTLLRQDLD